MTPLWITLYQVYWGTTQWLHYDRVIDQDDYVVDQDDYVVNSDDHVIDQDDYVVNQDDYHYYYFLL